MIRSEAPAITSHTYTYIHILQTPAIYLHALNLALGLHSEGHGRSFIWNLSSYVSSLVHVISSELSSRAPRQANGVKKKKNHRIILALQTSSLNK